MSSSNQSSAASTAAAADKHKKARSKISSTTSQTAPPSTITTRTVNTQGTTTTTTTTAASNHQSTSPQHAAAFSNSMPLPPQRPTVNRTSSVPGTVTQGGTNTNTASSSSTSASTSSSSAHNRPYPASLPGSRQSSSTSNDLSPTAAGLADVSPASASIPAPSSSSATGDATGSSRAFPFPFSPVINITTSPGAASLSSVTLANHAHSSGNPSSSSSAGHPPPHPHTHTSHHTTAGQPPSSSNRPLPSHPTTSTTTSTATGSNTGTSKQPSTSPPAPPQLKTFLTEGTLFHRQRGGSGGNVASISATLQGMWAAEPAPPPLSLGPDSQQSHTQQQQQMSNPPSPHHGSHRSNNTSPVPSPHFRPIQPSSLINNTGSGSSHVALRVHRSHNHVASSSSTTLSTATSTHSPSSGDSPLSPRSASHSTHNSSTHHSNISRDRSRERAHSHQHHHHHGQDHHSNKLNASFVSTRRDGIREKSSSGSHLSSSIGGKDGNSGKESDSDQSDKEADKGHGGVRLSSTHSPTTTTSTSSTPSRSLVSSLFSFFSYLHKIRKHIHKPEPRSRSTPALTSSGTGSSSSSSTTAGSSSSSTVKSWFTSPPFASSTPFASPALNSLHGVVKGKGARRGLWKWLLYINMLVLLLGIAYYVLLSSAPPLPLLLSFYFPSTVKPTSIYYHSPPATYVGSTEAGGAPVPVAAASFTIVSILNLPPSITEFAPESLSTDRSLLLRWHALMSWVLAVGPTNVLIYVYQEETCTWLIERAEVRGIKCFVVPAMHPTYKRPLLPPLFDHAHSHTNNQHIAFMARPAFLHPLIHTMLRNISASLARFLMVTRRTDVTLPVDLLSPYTFSLFTSSSYPFVVPTAPTYLPDYRSMMSPYITSLSAVFEYADHYGKLHSEYGIDLFIYPKSIFASLQFPPYLAGVYRWDNWLLSEMILRDDITVVDISNGVLPIVVHDGVEQEQHQTIDGAHYNDRLTKSRSGNQYKLGHANNADYRLQGICPQCYLIKNPQQSIAVLLAKRINKQQYLAIMTYEGGMEDVGMKLMHNWICWTKRIGFTNYVILVQDGEVAHHLTTHGIPVIQRSTDSVGDESTSSTTSGRAVTATDATSSALAGTPDFASFHVKVLHHVLKAGYHFFTAPCSSLWLDDPLVYLDHQFDVLAPVNVTTDTLTTAVFWSVRATTYGRDYIAKVRDCLDKSQVIPRTSAVQLECVGEVWKLMRKNKNVKRGSLPVGKYITAQDFFINKSSQRQGINVVCVDLSEMTKTPKSTEKLLSLLSSWHMLVHESTPAAGSNEKDTEIHRCIKPLYASLPSPADASTTPQFAFSLKIKIITSFRPRSLSALLTSLHNAVYDDDQVELEISIDGLPAVSPTEKEKQRHAEVIQIVHSFVWTQGSLVITEERESKKGPGQTGDWKGRGAFLSFLSSWQPSASNPKQVLLLLPEFVVLSPVFYQYIKRTVVHYYLDPHHYDAHMYGISLQSNMPILGTDTEVTTGDVPDNMLLYRYQLYGSLGTVFFPQHWERFQNWIQTKHYNTDHGMLFSLSLLDAFTNASTASSLSLTYISNPCIPSLPSNQWWLAWNDKYNHPVPTNTTLTFAIDHLYPLFFTRFLYETGSYALFPHFQHNQQLLLQSEDEKVRTIYSWSKEKEARLKAMNEQSKLTAPSLLSSLPFYVSTPLPSLASLPLFDVRGYDVNPRQIMIDEEGKVVERQSTSGGGTEGEGADVSVYGVDATPPHDDDSLSLSTVGNIERSKVLAYRSYQYQNTPQCHIVKRDRHIERQIEKEQQAAVAAASVAAAAAAAAQQRKEKKDTSASRATNTTLLPAAGDHQIGRGTITPPKAGINGFAGEEEERIENGEFLKKWKEGGRGE